LAFHNGRVKRRIVGRIVIRPIDYLHFVAVEMAAIRMPFQHNDVVNGLEWTYNGCVLVSPFFNVICTALRWGRTKLVGPYAVVVVALDPRVRTLKTVGTSGE
jgi:hypothetical protein